MKLVHWVADSQKRLDKFPRYVQEEVVYLIRLAQSNDTHQSIKKLKGFRLPIYEIQSDYNKNAYRLIYYIFKGKIYILHAFMKKSKRGTKIPKEDINIIKIRLKRVGSE